MDLRASLGPKGVENLKKKKEIGRGRWREKQKGEEREVKDKIEEKQNTNKFGSVRNTGEHGQVAKNNVKSLGKYLCGKLTL